MGLPTAGCRLAFVSAFPLYFWKKPTALPTAPPGYQHDYDILPDRAATSAATFFDGMDCTMTLSHSRDHGRTRLMTKTTGFCIRKFTGLTRHPNREI